MDAQARRFYTERDRRTNEYHNFTTESAGLWVGRDACCDAIGQQCVLTTVNMLARVHRKLLISVPDEPLRVKNPLFPAPTMHAALVALATAIDPYISVEFVAPRRDLPTVAVGFDGVPTGLPAYVGALGATALRSQEPLPLDHRGLSLGANMAACFAAASLFRHAHGLRMWFGGFSAWELCTTKDHTGPNVLPPLDVGDVLVVGAGAVGSALAYFLRERGHMGRWAIADGDIVTVHNLNRGLGMFASHAGWPTGHASNKALVAGAVADLEPHPCWYQEWLDKDKRLVPDLVLPLANGPGLRHMVNQLGLPILMHATTSRLWLAQLHRHVPGIDQCIDCRLPDTREPQFNCSKAPINQGTPAAENDAALPFLSAAAGLLLLAGLHRLQLGALLDDACNEWHLSFGERAPSARRRRVCAPDCRAVPMAPVRRRLHGATRWATLDDNACQVDD